MTSFSDAFGLTDVDPVSGFITGAPEAIFFDKSFQQMERVVVETKPVLRDSFCVQGQDFRGQAFDRDPGEDEEAGVIGHTMEVFFFGGFIPADERIAGSNGPGRRAPAEASDRPVLYKGDIFEMTSDNLAITEVMILLDQAVVKRFKRGIADQVKIKGIEV